MDYTCDRLFLESESFREQNIIDVMIYKKYYDIHFGISTNYEA